MKHKFVVQVSMLSNHSIEYSGHNAASMSADPTIVKSFACFILIRYRYELVEDGDYSVISYTVILTFEPAVSLEAAFKEGPLGISTGNLDVLGIPFDGEWTDADGKKITGSEFITQRQRSIRVKFPAFIDHGVISTWYDTTRRALCLLYCEGDGNALIRSAPTHRGTWEFSATPEAKGI